MPRPLSRKGGSLFDRCACVIFQVAEVAAAVKIPEFKVKQGVKIETDPTATSVAPSLEADDEGVIESLISKLQVGKITAA